MAAVLTCRPPWVLRALVAPGSAPQHGSFWKKNLPASVPDGERTPHHTAREGGGAGAGGGSRGSRGRGGGAVGRGGGRSGRGGRVGRPASSARRGGGAPRGGHASHPPATPPAAARNPPALAPTPDNRVLLNITMRLNSGKQADVVIRVVCPAALCFAGSAGDRRSPLRAVLRAPSTGGHNSQRCEEVLCAP